MLPAGLALVLASVQQSKPPLPGYQLAWHDEFDGKVIDSKKWKHWALGQRRDAFNTEDATKLDGRGHLVITTQRRQADVGVVYDTGGVWTAGLYEPTFGYFEARIKWQRQLGHWGAFWMNGGPMGDPVGDPAKGGVEVDFVEYHRNMLGGKESQHNIHWDGYGKSHKSKGVKVHDPQVDTGWHTFGCEIQPSGYRFFVDEKPTWDWSVAEGAPVSHQPEHLILSLEVGKWADDIAKAKLPDAMEVDWVRVWTRPE